MALVTWIEGSDPIRFEERHSLNNHCAPSTALPAAADNAARAVRGIGSRPTSRAYVARVTLPI